MRGSMTLVGPHAEDGGAKLDENPTNSAISTYSGHAFDVLDSNTWCYAHEHQRADIAVALSNVTRFNGHTKFYSVAEHSLRVADFLEHSGATREVQRLGIWHDAVEAYLGDIPRPQKNLFSIAGRPFRVVEDEIASAILEHFGVVDTPDAWTDVKFADMQVYLMERSERPFCAASHRYAATPSVAENMWLLREEKLRQ